MRTTALRILTPSGAIERKAGSVTALDATGSFGIMAGHRDLLTVLNPCIVTCRLGDDESYIAVDGGVMRVDKYGITVATREAYEGKLLSELKEVIEKRFEKLEEKEATFLDLLGNMEKLLIDNMVKFERGG